MYILTKLPQYLQAYIQIDHATQMDESATFPSKIPQKLK